MFHTPPPEASTVASSGHWMLRREGLAHSSLPQGPPPGTWWCHWLDRTPKSRGRGGPPCPRTPPHADQRSVAAAGPAAWGDRSGSSRVKQCSCLFACSPPPAPCLHHPPTFHDRLSSSSSLLCKNTETKETTVMGSFQAERAQTGGSLGMFCNRRTLWEGRLVLTCLTETLFCVVSGSWPQWRLKLLCKEIRKPGLTIWKR